MKHTDHSKKMDKLVNEDIVGFCDRAYIKLGIQKKKIQENMDKLM